MNIKLHTILPFLLLLLVAGCTTDDRLDCFNETSLELRFEYDAGQDTPFTEVITAVDAILFNGNGIYMGYYRIEKDELTTQRTVRTTVDPGNYYAISWANVHENTLLNEFIPGKTTLDECMLMIPESSTETGDPVYYAIYRKDPQTRNDTNLKASFERNTTTRNGIGVINEINVPRGKSVVAEMGFVRAHRTINVWIEGYIDINQPGLEPTVRANNLWTHYSFLFTTHPSKRSFSQVAQLKELEGKMYHAVNFHSALGPIEEDMFIIVCRSSDGAASCTVNLRQFVQDNNITQTDEINMLLRYYDLGVTVTLPAWEEKQVTPGID